MGKNLAIFIRLFGKEKFKLNECTDLGRNYVANNNKVWQLCINDLTNLPKLSCYEVHNSVCKSTREEHEFSRHAACVTQYTIRVIM